MGYANVSANLSPADKAAVEAALNTIKAKLKFLVHLTPEERQALVKMGDGSLAFVSKVHEYVKSHPQYCPPHLDVAEFENDFILADALRVILQTILPLAEGIEHTEMALGSELMEYARGYYNIVSFAKTTNAPGSETIFNDLELRYPHSKRGFEQDEAPAA